MLSFSTEEPVAVGTPQYNFITADLAAVNRTLTPWVIVNGHRPVSQLTKRRVALAVINKEDPLWARHTRFMHECFHQIVFYQRRQKNKGSSLSP